ncbi:universal stress protein [Polaromonas sp.]|uniref:universal stress protein n=1 Tax=Polaromonas sp. TaxID=1869339 RepID=UPI00286B6636|nr:universal stress protein [Polaromonas sp.]
MKILLAVDGSAYTKKMLAYLVAHNEVFGTASQYTVFTAQPPLPPRVRAAVGASTLNGYYADEVEKIMGPVCKFLLRHAIEAKSEWKSGPAGEAISKFAQAGKFDMIIMGSHGHGALANLVMGSVATQVLAHSTVPVLLVR